MRPANHLLFSANLAPGADYGAGVREMLPLYDNPQTRDWLLTFLFDLGVARATGSCVSPSKAIRLAGGLQRIEANFHFGRALHGFRWTTKFFNSTRAKPSASFSSYRHTPERVRALLAPHGLAVVEQWLAPSGEEGVFLCRKNLN